MRYAYFYPACYSLYAKKRAFHRPALFFYGWGTWIRTKEMPDSESGALPLGYTPIIRRRMMGIEPTHARATIWCVNHFTTFAISLTRAVGIEPTLKVLETLVLPLNYARNMEGEGFEPPNPKERIYSPPRLARLRYPSIMVARDGIEPPTQGASILCSTD